MNRKKRSDRRHIVYSITNAVTGEFYIGITQGFRQRDLKIRVQKHIRRALTEGKSWSLCCAIRSYGAEVFVSQIVEVVRGKATAHQLERQLIGEYSPTLNTQ
jgi:predicted GIY-YIG superfamily endonuclease